MNTFKIAYKHIPFGCEFEHNGQKYIKTNFMRGYYWENGRKKFRYFKKKTLVTADNEKFNW